MFHHHVGTRAAKGHRASRSVLRRPVAAVLSLALAGFLFAALPAFAEDEAEAHPDERPDAAAALVLARQTGKPVRITEQTTETSESFAMPDGEIEATVAAGVVRFHRDGRWVPVDLTLRRGDGGTVEPVAHPADLTLSAGRAAPTGELASIDAGAGRISLGWNGVLPSPVLQGNKATYPDLMPDVDLVVEATRTGFEQFVVLKSRAAVGQIDQLSLPLQGAGAARVTEDSDGGFDIVNDSGKVIAAVPTPVMWDAHVAADGESPTRSAEIDVEVAAAPVATAKSRAVPGHGADAPGVALSLSPDEAWLTSPDTRYPVTIDPQINRLVTAFDTTVMEGVAADRGGANYLQLGATTETSPKRARSFVKWDSADLRGKRITTARAYFYNWYSTTCTAAPWEIWTTEPADAETRWANQPKWLRKEATSTETKGLNSSCGDGWVSIDARSFFQHAADTNQTRADMGIRAAGEADKKQWKEFRSRNAVNTAQVPYAKITYADKPDETTTTYGVHVGAADESMPVPSSTTRTEAVMEKWRNSQAEWPGVPGAKDESEAELLARTDPTEASIMSAPEVPDEDPDTYEVDIDDDDETLDAFEPEPDPELDSEPETDPGTDTPAPTTAIQAMEADEADEPPAEEEWLNEAEADPEYVTAEAPDASAQAVKKKPHEDWMTRAQCREGWKRHKIKANSWFYKNKFSMCQITYAYVWFNTCTNGSCQYSDVAFNIMYIGAGSHSKRAVNWYAYIYDWSQTGRPNLAAPFTLDIRCNSYYSAKCYRKGGAVKKALSSWKAKPNYVSNYTTKAVKPAAADPKLREKRSYHMFTPVFIDPVNKVANRGGGMPIRCDLAKYLGRKKPGGCIGNDLVGTFVLDYKSRKHGESARFIWKSMFRLSQIDSNKASKYVPGGAYRQPVTGRWETLARAYWGKKRKDRTNAQRECVRLYGRDYAAGGKQCDEYPFAATYEGAHSVPLSGAPRATFAVLLVTASQNEAAGTRLAVYYNRDHILDGDRFYVSIINGPPV
jgi:hypothetical protein